MVARAAAKPRTPPQKIFKRPISSQPAMAAPAIIPAIRPPMKPDQVLFGEKRGHSLGPPTALPTR
ncbi:hypothetical protein D3C75_1340020 [compost metagenome]